jgi:hypothetical protein
VRIVGIGRSIRLALLSTDFSHAQSRRRSQDQPKHFGRYEEVVRCVGRQRASLVGHAGRSEEIKFSWLCWASSILRARPPNDPRVPLHEERAFAPCSLACASQKLNKQLTDLFRLLLFEPVSRSINKMSPAHLRTGGTLHPLECAGNLENTPVALSAYE